jgi:hypothetical protein
MRLRLQLLTSLVAAPALLAPSFDLEPRVLDYDPSCALPAQRQATARPARARCVRCQRPAWTIAVDGAYLCRTCAAV